MHSDKDGIVLEPFSGSGTVIISAEQTERKCYAMELSPVYGDLAVRRWEEFTGETAVRLGGINLLEIVNIKTANIKPFENNAKSHPLGQIQQIKRSITQFQMNDPIAIDENNVVIEGHGRLLALKELNINEAPCIRLTHLTENEKCAYILAHNKLTLNTGFDLDLLTSKLDFLRDSGFFLPFLNNRLAL